MNFLEINYESRATVNRLRTQIQVCSNPTQYCVYIPYTRHSGDFYYAFFFKYLSVFFSYILVYMTSRALNFVDVPQNFFANFGIVKSAFCTFYKRPRNEKSRVIRVIFKHYIIRVSIFMSVVLKCIIKYTRFQSVIVRK